MSKTKTIEQLGEWKCAVHNPPEDTDNEGQYELSYEWVIVRCGLWDNISNVNEKEEEWDWAIARYTWDGWEIFKDEEFEGKAIEEYTTNYCEEMDPDEITHWRPIPNGYI